MRAAIGDLQARRHDRVEEAALTEGQGRALSGHKTTQAYRGYAKETFDGALAATRKSCASRGEQLVINLKTAKALGLAISPAVLARADDVIE
jgi:hypothetical protein